VPFGKRTTADTDNPTVIRNPGSDTSWFRDRFLRAGTIAADTGKINLNVTERTLSGK
jgi:hypothetical protein